MRRVALPSPPRDQPSPGGIVGNARGELISVCAYSRGEAKPECGLAPADLGPYLPCRVLSGPPRTPAARDEALRDRTGNGATSHRRSGLSLLARGPPPHPSTHGWVSIPGKPSPPRQDTWV